MKTHKLSIVVLLNSLWFLSCVQACTPAWQDKPNQSDTERVINTRRTIATWLECEECGEGQLEAVVKLGATAIPSLIATLQNGPSPANRELYRRQLVKTYQDLKRYEATHPKAKMTMGQEEYVKTYLDNYQALYQIRAAIALSAIGGKDAQQSLENAIKPAVREDVKKAINDGLEKLKKTR